MSIVSYKRLRCLSINPVLKSFMSSSSSDSFTNLKPINSDSGWGGLVPESTVSSRDKLESPSDAGTKLTDWLNAEAIEEDERSGIGEHDFDRLCNGLFFLLRNLRMDRI